MTSGTQPEPETRQQRKTNRNN